MTMTDGQGQTEKATYRGTSYRSAKKIGSIERQPLLEIKIITNLMIQSFLISYYHMPNTIMVNVFYASATKHLGLGLSVSP